jgi:benzil reductase ((S)-benzoin forming)
MVNYIIITGTSRGLGEALARNLIKPDNHLFCISRTKNANLINIAKNDGVPLDYFKFDLNNLKGLRKLFKKIFKRINLNTANSISLINNAGILTPITTADKYNDAEVIDNIEINLLAPILTNSYFIKHTAEQNLEKRIINISSGAANKAYYGWGPYCASKAGLNIFSKCAHLEQMNKKYPVKIFSVAPGVVDTQMQATIRNAKKDDFNDLERFIAYKQDGKLMPPDFVAKKIIKLLTTKEFEGGNFIDIKEIN